MIELEDWILPVSLDDHEEIVGSIERVMVDSGAAVSVCSLGYAPEVPMSNHSRRATLRTASGAQIEDAGQKMVEYENGDGGLVNVNFEVADETTPLVAVGELQKRGMSVVMGPHGSIATRGQVMEPPGSNLDLEHSNGAHLMCLTRGEKTSFNMIDRESQSMAAALRVMVASDLLVRFFLAMLDACGRSDVKVLLRSEQEETLTLILREVQARHQQGTLVECSPVESHATMGGMEGASRILGGILRTMLNATAMRVSGRLLRRNKFGTLTPKGPVMNNNFSCGSVQNVMSLLVRDRERLLLAFSSR